MPAPETLRSLAPPPVASGAYSVLVDTYASPRESAAAEMMLRTRKLPYYAIDLPYRDGVRRRLLVGRYADREQAEGVRAKLASVFVNARVVTAAVERLP